MTACSVARSHGFKILSRHRKAADGLPLKAPSEAEKSWTAHEKRGSFMNLLFASCGCWRISSARCYRGRPKSIFTWASGNESGFSQPPFSLLPTLFVPFSPCMVSSHILSLEFCSWHALTHFSFQTHLAKLLTCEGILQFLPPQIRCFLVVFYWKQWKTQSETCQGSNTDLKHSLTCKFSPSVIYTLWVI